MQGGHVAYLRTAQRMHSLAVEHKGILCNWAWGMNFGRFQRLNLGPHAAVYKEAHKSAGQNHMFWYRVLAIRGTYKCTCSSVFSVSWNLGSICWKSLLSRRTCGCAWLSFKKPDFAYNKLWSARWSGSELIPSLSDPAPADANDSGENPRNGGAWAPRLLHARTS